MAVGNHSRPRALRVSCDRNARFLERDCRLSKRDESTVRRWEKEGLPVHRHTHKRKATVYAHKSEIDVW